MSVLAHVVLNGSLQNEPAATQSLAYILKKNPNVARAFVGMLGVAKIEFIPGDIHAELGHENGKPDLTIYDDQNRVRAFVENKFWARLTDAQPVSYHRALPDLPEGVATALLFIAPRLRVTTVWNELQQRCSQAKLNWENCGNTDSITWSCVDGKFLLITSWTHVLDTLLNTPDLREHDSIRHDILQLQDLTSRIDELERFLPIRADELTDQETPCRLINYYDLVEPITQKLQNNKLADECSKIGGSWAYYGRYLRVHQRFKLWFGIHFDKWRKFGVTPLWWMFDNNYDGVRGHVPTIRNLFDDAYYDEQSEELCIPIRLKIGVDRDTVVQDAAEQMIAIANMLKENIPNQPL